MTIVGTVVRPNEVGVISALNYLRSLSWMGRAVSDQYLEGLTDGVSRVFRVPFAPISSDPVPAFYVIENGEKLAIDVDTINYDSGEVVFENSLQLPPLGSYTALAVPNSALASASLMGFTEMQVRWPRKLYVYEGEILAQPDSAEATVFNTSVVQNAFLNRCAEYELCRMMSTGAVLNAMSYREEGMGGLLVDTTKQPKDWASLLVSLQESLRTTEDSARSESGDMFRFGSFLPGPQLVNGAWTDASF